MGDATEDTTSEEEAAEQEPEISFLDALPEAQDEQEYDGDDLYEFDTPCGKHTLNSFIAFFSTVKGTCQAATDAWLLQPDPPHCALTIGAAAASSAARQAARMVAGQRGSSMVNQCHVTDDERPSARAS